MQAVLEHVSTCQTISQQLGGFATGDPKDPIPLLLLLFEFESKLVLNPGGLNNSLEKALHIPSIDAKTLETMAALCSAHSSGTNTKQATFKRCGCCRLSCTLFLWMGV